MTKSETKDFKLTGSNLEIVKSILNLLVPEEGKSKVELSPNPNRNRPYPIFPIMFNSLRVEYTGCGMERSGPKDRMYYSYKISLVPTMIPSSPEILTVSDYKPEPIQNPYIRNPYEFNNGVLNIIALTDPDVGMYKIVDYFITDVLQMRHNNWLLYSRYVKHSIGFGKNSDWYNKYHDKAYDMAITEFLNCLKEQYLNNPQEGKNMTHRRTEVPAKLTGNSLDVFQRLIKHENLLKGNDTVNKPTFHMSPFRGTIGGIFTKLNGLPLEMKINYGCRVDKYGAEEQLLGDTGDEITIYDIYIKDENGNKTGIRIGLNNKTNESFILEVIDANNLDVSLKSKYNAAVFAKGIATTINRTQNTSSIIVTKDINIVNLATQFTDKFLEYVKEVYLDGRRDIAGFGIGIASIGSMLGKLGEYENRYVYGHARTTDKALIYNIPEVKKIFNAINLLDDSVEDKSLLQDFIYGVMTDHIHLRGVLGTQYDTNLLVKWTPAVDPYSGKPGYFKYKGDNCERESDEQEEEIEN